MYVNSSNKKIEGKLRAGERRVLNTKWVAKAWVRVKKQPDVIKDSYKKRGLSNNADRIEDDIGIKGTEGYEPF